MAGTGSISSSITSTSHTLTFMPGMAANHQPPPALPNGTGTGAGPAPSSSLAPSPAFAALLEALRPENRHAFLRPSRAIPDSSLQLAKETLDAFAAQVGDEQQERLARERRDKKGTSAAAARGKRKREHGGSSGAGGQYDRERDALKIRRLHVDGLQTAQVWQQAKRIINSALKEGMESVRELKEKGEVVEAGDESGEGSYVDEEEALNLDSGDEELDLEDGSGLSEDDDEEEDEEEEEEDDELEDIEAEDLDEEGLDGDDYEEDEEENEEGDLDTAASQYVEDPNGLNDGFFSIDDFNKQSQWFEDQDARADPNTDLASEDEDLNWHTDPFSASSKPTKPSKSKKGKEVEEEEEQDVAIADDNDDEYEEDEGPLDMDASFPDGLDEEALAEGFEDGMDLGMDLTANDVYYKDFFAPPPRKAKKGFQFKNSGPSRPTRPDDADIERAMNDVHRDLFEDLSERSDSEDALSDVSAGDPRSRRSAHERRQAKLAEEIRKLEAESVAKRAWVLSGEASATERPINSLLQEDLDFEHAGKPLPVITEEVSESIEATIKRRILAQEFDEVLRRRPGIDDVPSGTRRGLVEVDDTKAQQSLAEIYEEEHVKNANPDTYVSKADEKLRKEEQEVLRMWREVSGKLDALSSWHYRPKPAAPGLTVVADVATVAMEDAQPATAQGVAGGDSSLAPQEIYAANAKTAQKGEVVTGAGLPLAQAEMSREEKTRRRRREKERIRKAGGTDAKNSGANGGANANGPSKRAQEQKETMGQLKRGGVRVINRRGEVLGLDGKKAAEPKAISGGGFKL